MKEIRVSSTSNRSAKVSDIVLRMTSTTRLVFRPSLVDNPHDRSAAVRGHLIYQRKGSNEEWEDVPHESLSTLKKGEGYALELHSEATLRLFRELEALYKLYKQEGIPWGEEEYVRAEGTFKQLAQIDIAELEEFMNANETIGSDVTARLLRWAVNTKGIDELLPILESLDSQQLANLNTAVSISALSEALKFWEQNKENPSEEFWQRELAERSFLLQLVFSWPCVILKEKAYVGGKTIENTGGGLLDYLMQNRLTANVALVEIKTPLTDLVGRDYRDGIPNIHKELTGGVIQVVSYRKSLYESYRIMRGPGETYEVFDPSCVVIIGNTDKLDTPEKKRSFELFRQQLKDVQVITFDELFTRVEELISLLQE